MKQYRNRIADTILRRKLEGIGAILIEGPKWCGKTTTAEQVAGSVLYMDEPGKKEQNIEMSNLRPQNLLLGKTPRLIDEWQVVADDVEKTKEIADEIVILVGDRNKMCKALK